MPDGPLVVKGEFITIGPNGKELKKMRIASFCRCGQSKNMPYCDGTHRKVGFYSR
jgi:CDGSH-type Zn-finger protein